MNIINVFNKLIDINDSIIREIISIINQNYFTSKEKPNELFLLKRKREQEFFKPNSNQDIIFHKENTFSIANSSKPEKMGQINESRNFINEIKLDPINYEVNNFKKSLSESSRNLKQEECNEEKIIKDVKEGNLFNNSFKIRSPSAKLKYFNIEKNISKKSVLDNKTNNKIKVLKNKKIVYINADLLDKYSVKKIIKKSKNINFVKINKTYSKYRGVSRNGNQWQVLIMSNNKKYYLGSYRSEEFAAKVYDIFAIKMKGIKARTNFIYNNIQIKNIFEKNINIKNDEIAEIMMQISNEE